MAKRDASTDRMRRVLEFLLETGHDHHIECPCHLSRQGSLTATCKCAIGMARDALAKDKRGREG